MYLSLIIPAFNEVTKITRDLEAASAFLNALQHASELLVVDDGSWDETLQVVKDNYQKYQTDKVSIRPLHYPSNKGKGYAIRFGVRHAKGKIIAFADAGLCVPFSNLQKGIELIEQGFDYAIASRRHSETKIQEEQPLYRQLGSKGFWFIVKGVMGVDVTDSQCGFKVYWAHSAREIFSRVKTNGFMFDVEALMIADKLGFQKAEFPVEWSNDADTRYHPVWGTVRNFTDLAKIRLRSFQKDS